MILITPYPSSPRLATFTIIPNFTVLSLRRGPIDLVDQVQTLFQGVTAPGLRKKLAAGCCVGWWGDGPSTFGVDVFGEWWSQRLCQTRILSQTGWIFAKYCSRDQHTQIFGNNLSKHTNFTCCKSHIVTSVSQHALRSITQDMATRKVRRCLLTSVNSSTNPPWNGFDDGAIADVT